MANTIDSKLQLTEVLDSAMTALKRSILPLRAFSTAFSNVQLKGNDKMAVPFYPLTSLGTSQTRAANGSRKALAGSTTTEAREVSINRNKLQAISFTAADVNRQPVFDPAKHGQLKGDALALDIIYDIFSAIRHSDFDGKTIAAAAGSNFDEDDVADLRTYASEAFWPQTNRSLILNPTYYGNLMKQEQVVDAGKHGDGGFSFREGRVNRVQGFEVYEAPGLPSNSWTSGLAVTGANASDVFTTAVDHGLKVGDRVIFPTLTGGSSLTAATKKYFVVAVPTSKTFQVSATAGGSPQDLGSDVSDGTVRKFEDIQGIACLPSALLVGFAPVTPTAAIREALYDYEEITDAETGLTLQYYHIGYPDTDEEVQTIECHYGFEIGDTAQAKLISATTLT